MIELDEDFDADARQLCPDDACIGVIGDDGRCKVCGRAGEGAPARTRSIEARPLDDDSDDEGDGDEAEAARAASGDDGDFAGDERRLCPDDACIGLLGDDDRCKLCGRSPASN